MTSSQRNVKYPSAFVSSEANIHDNVTIDPNAIIEENVEIGSGTYIGPNVILKSGVKIGRKSYISAGTLMDPDSHNLEFWKKDTPSPNGWLKRIEIGEEVHIEPSAVLHGNITIDDKTWIGSHVNIHDGARVGKNCKIFPGAVISAIPQDLKFHGEKTTLEIGDNTTIREFATLNRGTDYHGKTVIGKNCLLMAYVHIAHDCLIGDNVIMSNSVNMAGHVEIDDHVVIGGVVGIHQFVKVGKHAMIQAGSLLGKDVPPYVIAGRFPVRYEGVNSIGLRRRGFESETIQHIQEIYRHIFLSGRNNSDAIDYVAAHLDPTEERDEVITFIRNATRGIIKKPQRS